MKRKVIFLAGKTGVLSLPTNWLRDHNIQKGDELELLPILEGLLITKPNSHQEKSIELNIDSINSRLLFRYLNSLYKQGYTEIKLTFQESEILTEETTKIKTLDAIQKITDYLIGLEIIKQSKNYCIIKEVSSVKEGEFETLLRRIFLMIISTSKDLLEAIKSKDYETIKNIHNYIDPNINKLFKLCQRIISTERKYWNKLVSNALLTEKLERIGDLYSAIARIFDKKINVNEKALVYFKDTNLILEEFYELFYKYKKEKLNEFHLNAKKLKSKINQDQEEYDGQAISLLTNLKEINNQLREAIDDLISIKVLE